MVHLFPPTEVELGITISSLLELTHPTAILVIIITYFTKFKKSLHELGKQDYLTGFGVPA